MAVTTTPERDGRHAALIAFDRDFFSAQAPLTYVGAGELGGKAHGLVSIAATLAGLTGSAELAGSTVAIPYLTVLTTSCFDAFMANNRLERVIAEGFSDDEIARTFLRAELPPTLVGDLRAVASQVKQPLAVRSSSMLEDASEHPFAGVFATKMIPNNELDADGRFRKLVEAVKLVWASTFFAEARSYRAVAGFRDADEKMAVIIQEVVGARHGDRFYPDVSGVARSVNYYPTGLSRPEDGVAELALGLGKWIVDGEPSWNYSPAWPKAPPPFNSPSDILKFTQTCFWAVNMGTARYDPVREAEYLVRASLADAESDDTLHRVASTFDPNANRLVAGITAKGPRVVNFAPLLQYGAAPVNEIVKALLRACGDTLGCPVEIEFAVTLPANDTGPTRFAFLQVRPMQAAAGGVELEEGELRGQRVLLASTRALGCGDLRCVADVVYARPEHFDVTRTPEIAAEVAELNRTLIAEGRPYLVVGFGRWGTSDPWGGIPVNWAQISGARAIVEAQLPGLRPELSQGSHFFHNLTAFRALYLSLDAAGSQGVDWGWLDRHAAAYESPLVRHVHLSSPLVIKVDGRSGRGVVLHE